MSVSIYRFTVTITKKQVFIILIKILFFYYETPYLNNNNIYTYLLGEYCKKKCALLICVTGRKRNVCASLLT